MNTSIETSMELANSSGIKKGFRGNDLAISIKKCKTTPPVEIMEQIQMVEAVEQHCQHP